MSDSKCVTAANYTHPNTEGAADMQDEHSETYLLLIGGESEDKLFIPQTNVMFQELKDNSVNKVKSEEPESVDAVQRRPRIQFGEVNPSKFSTLYIRGTLIKKESGCTR